MSFTVEGQAPLNTHWLLTLTDPTDTIVIAFDPDTEPPLRLDGLSAAAEVVVDGFDRTVLVDDVAIPSAVVPGSGWPGLVPGDNTVTVTGATANLTYTPLHL